MSSLPALSIVTVSFNQARFLRESLDSVISQKCEGIDYVVVDPGSTDDSRNLISERAPHIDRMVFEPDAGPADGLNKGFHHARGEIFGYINADDRLAEGALDYVRRYFAAHPDVDVICGTIRIIDQNGTASWRARTADTFDVRRYAAHMCTVGQQATFFRRRAFERAGGFNVHNRVAWDGELMVDMALSGARFATVRRRLGDFRVYRGTISNSSGYMERLIAYYRALDQKLSERGIKPYSPVIARLFQLAYRANPIRHMNYLIAGLG